MNNIAGRVFADTAGQRSSDSMHKLLRKCFSFVDRSTAWQGLGVGVLILFATALEAVSIGLIFPFIKLVADPTEIHRMAWLGALIPPVASGEERRILAMLAGALLGIFIFKNILLSAVYFVQLRFVAMNEALLARHLFARYLNGSYALHLTRNSAEYIRNITGTLSTVFSGVFMGFITLSSECLLIIALAIVLLVAEPLLTVGASLILAAGVGIYFGLVKQHLVVWGTIDQNLKKQILQTLQQGLHSIKELKVLGRESFIVEGLAKDRIRLAQNQTIKNMMTSHAPRLWMESVMITGVLLVVIFILVDEGVSGEEFPALTLFAAAAFRLIPSMNRILNSLTTIKNGTYSVNVIYEDMKTFGADADDVAMADGKALPFLDAIHMEKVSFAYPNSDDLVLKDIDLVIRKGESVGLVGPSGGGKTTLVDVLLGLLTPSSGRVAVDGADVNDAKRAWRTQIGYVPQTIYLIDDTMRRNIAFGLADDEIEEEKVLNALRLARLESLVQELPKGLETPLGEHGVRLSGGQAQRVGIARALYRDPAVLILDEATSSLDNETEREINDAIDRLSGDKTLVIIAHRLSTVRKCNRLVFLSGGRVMDIGKFEELNERNAEFHRMVELSKL